VTVPLYSLLCQMAAVVAIAIARRLIKFIIKLELRMSLASSRKDEARDGDDGSAEESGVQNWR
jgi:hypothetical protein